MALKDPYRDPHSDSQREVARTAWLEQRVELGPRGGLGHGGG